MKLINKSILCIFLASFCLSGYAASELKQQSEGSAVVESKKRGRVSFAKKKAAYKLEKPHHIKKKGRKGYARVVINSLFALGGGACGAALGFGSVLLSWPGISWYLGAAAGPSGVGMILALLVVPAFVSFGFSIGGYYGFMVGDAFCAEDKPDLAKRLFWSAGGLTGFVLSSALSITFAIIAQFSMVDVRIINPFVTSAVLCIGPFVTSAGLFIGPLLGSYCGAQASSALYDYRTTHILRQPLAGATVSVADQL